MQGPQEFSSGFQDAVRKGLHIVGDGVNGIAQVLSSTDSAVRTLDTSLTGRRPAANAKDEEEVAQQVVSLVRRGREQAAAGEDPTSPGLVGSFREALSHMNLVPAPSGLAGLLPDSPRDLVRTGLRDLRGSAALVRLVSGRGDLGDVEEIASFAEDLMNRVEQVGSAVTGSANPGPPATPPAEENPARVETRRPSTRPPDLPGCMAADESLTVMGHLQGLSRGLGGFGVLRSSVGRLQQAASGARRMKAPEIAEELEQIAAKLPSVRTKKAAAEVAEELQPVVDRAWELGRKCGINAGRLQRLAEAEASGAAG